MRALEQDMDFYVVDDPGFTTEEAYALLAGVGPNTFTLPPVPMVAAANEGHTGAMIALVPSDADLKRLALKGGEKAEQLHLTLLFLGEADEINAKAREQITNIARRYAKTPVEANAFSVNVFNPSGDEPCLVMGVGNGGTELENVRSNVASAVRGMSGYALAEQHTPWVPHVTIAYTDDLSKIEELASRTGPITFDKIRVAFGDEITDIPLTPKADPNAGAELLPTAVVTDANVDEIMTSAAIAGNIMRALASDRNLRNYWIREGGAAKIRWGTDGSFSRCVRHLRKHVARPEGLCAEYHKEATGEWPAEKGVESSMTPPLVAHGHHNQQDHNPHKGFHVPESDFEKRTIFPSRDSGYNDAHDAPTRAGNVRRMNELEDQADSDEGLSGAEADELRKLRKLYGDLREDVKPEDASDYDPDDYGLHPLIATARKNKKNEYSDESWEGILAVEGTESGDGRIFNLGALDWAALPQPLMYQPANVGGHNASIVAGEITQIARKGNEIRGWGHVYGNMLAGEHGDGIRNMMTAGGVSVDVDKVKDADVEEVFADDDEGGFMSKPETTIFNRGRVRGATLVAFPAFVEAKLSFSNQVTTAAVEDSCGCSSGVLVASGHTITIPDLPDPSWFVKPTDVKMYGALTITDEGRVFGWVAPSDTTHRSVRKLVPMGRRVDYSRWMNKETIVAGGGRIKTGVITMGCGHAATENYGTLMNRKEHYDNTCSIFANVVVGEEPGKGVWFAGALRHGVTASQVTAAMGSSLSGDWQPHPDRPGIQEFIAALLVPVPGFPMARSRPSVEWQDGLITASVVPVRFGAAEPRSRDELACESIAQAKSLIMASIGLDPASEKRAAMALIDGM